jgi:hypothetical protein
MQPVCRMRDSAGYKTNLATGATTCTKWAADKHGSAVQ